MRRARTINGTGVLCARYMCPRAVEAPGACARGAAPAGAAQRRRFAAPPCRRPAPSPVAAQQSQRHVRLRAPAASPIEGKAPLLRGPPGPAVPDGHPRRAEVAHAHGDEAAGVWAEWWRHDGEDAQKRVW